MVDKKPILPCNGVAVPHEEALAAIEHQQWCHWTKYMIQTMRAELEQIDPKLVETLERLPSVMRWRSQLVRPYFMLTEDEKKSDRIEVRLKRPGYLASTTSAGPSTLEEKYMTVEDINDAMRNRPATAHNIPPPPPAVPLPELPRTPKPAERAFALDDF